MPNLADLPFLNQQLWVEVCTNSNDNGVRVILPHLKISVKSTIFPHHNLDMKAFK
jgi:hypothetical protein